MAQRPPLKEGYQACKLGRIGKETVFWNVQNYNCLNINNTNCKAEFGQRKLSQKFMFLKTTLVYNRVHQFTGVQPRARAGLSPGLMLVFSGLLPGWGRRNLARSKQ